MGKADNNKTTTIMNKPVKIILEVLLLAGACYLGYRAVANVKGTIDFGTEREAREAVAIQRLSDIRELEKAYYNRYGVYQDTFAVLKDFYLNQSIATMYENGSLTDTVATEMTDKIKQEILKKYERQKVKFGKTELERKNDSLNISLYRDYYLTDTIKYKDLQFKVPIMQPVHTQLFTNRPDFVIDSLEFVPFSGGKKISYWAHVEDDETGSSVPVYEVKIPYEDLLTGLDENEIRAWCKDRLKFDHDRPKSGIVDPNDTLHARDQRTGLQIGGDFEFNNGNGNWK